MSALGTVQEFCRSIGVSEPDSLPAELLFERAGQVTIESDEADVLISLRREVSLFREGIAAAALEAVNPERGLPFRVHAGFLAEDTVVFLMAIAETQLDLPTLDRAISLLASLAAQTEAAVS